MAQIYRQASLRIPALFLEGFASSSSHLVFTEADNQTRYSRLEVMFGWAGTLAERSWRLLCCRTIHQRGSEKQAHATGQERGCDNTDISCEDCSKYLSTT